MRNKFLLTLLFVLCATGVYAQAPKLDQDDGSISANQATQLTIPLTYVFDGAAWRRLTFGTAGTASAQVWTVQGIASMTPVAVSQATGTNLHMVCDSGCSSSTAPADEASFTFGTTPQSPIGGVFQTTATNNALTNGQMGAWQFTAQRAGFVNLRSSTGTEFTNTAGALDINVKSGGSTTVTDSATISAGQSSVALVDAALFGYNTVGSNYTRAILDPCEQNAQTSTPISMTTATTTRIIAPTSSKKTYICGLTLMAGAADNVAIVEGTGGTCGTGTAGVFGGTTAANGMNAAANGGLNWPAGKVAHMVTAGSNVDFCLITSSTGPLAGVVKWVQQ